MQPTLKSDVCSIGLVLYRVKLIKDKNLKEICKNCLALLYHRVLLRHRAS